MLDGASTPQRTKSILNLTSSTLFGIYRDTDYTTDREESSTPWGTGAESPVGSRKASIDMLRSSIPDAFAKNSKTDTAKRKTPQITRRRSHHVRKGLKGYWLPLALNTSALFVAGLLYGALVSHLHDKNDIAPIRVEGIDHSAWQYLAFWGFAGILLGHALPYVDELWKPQQDGSIGNQLPKQKEQGRGSGAWDNVVRSVGAFVGIAFAIRKVSWQSTIQLSLTLAAVNPCLWYLIDRTVPGFIVSTAVALSGTAMLLGINPDLVPAPSTGQLASHIVQRPGQKLTFPAKAARDLPVFGIFSEESLAVATWIASVLFVSSVCFGNIGRKLAESRAV